MLILLMVIAILLTIYLYYWNTATFNFPPKSPKLWQADLEHLQQQINQLKNPKQNHD